MQFEEDALRLNASDFVYRSNAKAKQQRRESADFSPRFVPIEKKNWIDIEQRKYSFSEYEPSSSSFTTCVSRTRRSGSFLEN